METENNKSTPPQPSPPSESGEKVLQPLTPGLTPAATVNVSKRPLANNYPASNSTAGTYNPTLDPNHPAPAPQPENSTDTPKIKPVALRHKSLLVLALWGLFSALLSALTVLSVHARNYLYIAGTITAINVIMYLYLLLSKNDDGVVLILKILFWLLLIPTLLSFGVSIAFGNLRIIVNVLLLLYIWIVIKAIESN